jgi:hypothetical protein
MKKILPGLILGLLIGAGATWVLLSRPAAEASADKPAGPDITTGSAVISKQLAALGLTFAAPQSVDLAREIKGYGRVLDPTPLAGLVADLRTAQAAANASTQDYNRVRQLHDQGENASQQAVESAQAALLRDRAQLGAAESRLYLAWGRTLAGRTDLDDLLHALAVGDAALVRIDVAASDASATAPVKAWVSPLSGDTGTHSEVELLGSAPAADPQAQGAGYLALWRGHPLAPGAALSASLVLPGGSQKRLVLPRSAFVRHEGGVFVYVQNTEGGYERRIVTVGAGIGNGIVVTDGITGQDQVVVTGAQQLLATEILGSAGGEED